jgi:four helix bundle protein
VKDGKDHNKEKDMAIQSYRELEVWQLSSQRVGLLDQAKTSPILSQAERISRMLSGLRKALEKHL